MKMRLIDIDSIPLKEALKRESIYDHDRYIHVKVLEWMLENAPTVDAVPVIRCRECKHRLAILMNGQPVVMLCGNERNDEAFSVDIDDYCSRAERKEE